MWGGNFVETLSIWLVTLYKTTLNHRLHPQMLMTDLQTHYKELCPMPLFFGLLFVDVLSKLTSRVNGRLSRKRQSWLADRRHVSFRNAEAIFRFPVTLQSQQRKLFFLFRYCL